MGPRRREIPATIRQMQVEDIPAGLHLCRLSGWNQLEDDWLAFLDSPDGGGRLAESEGITIGTVAFLRYGGCFSWLSMMLVHPEARHAGVGTRLMDAALDALAGETCVRLDATPLGADLYRWFGFSGEYELVRATITARSGHLDPVPENVRPMGASDLAKVFARDRQIFGADRSTVLASFYKRAPDLAWTVHRGEALLGYCFGRPGHLYRQLGPVVAEDASIAGNLVARCSIGEPQERLAIDVPRRVPKWIAWLESAGFTTERPFLRMCRGQTHCPGLPAQQFAIAGPEFG
jgi:GNAT superfamily N-acetyltransferase